MRKVLPILVAMLAVSAPVGFTAAVAAPAAVSKTKAVYSVQETSLGTLLDDPASRAILKKHAPTILNHPQVEMAKPLTLAQLQRFSGDVLSDDVLTKIDGALKAAAPK